MSGWVGGDGRVQEKELYWIDVWCVMSFFIYLGSEESEDHGDHQPGRNS